MRKYRLTVITFYLIGALCFSESSYGCNLSDKEAINLAVQFCSKMGIVYKQKPWVLDTYHWGRVYDQEYKNVVIGARGDYKIDTKVSCDNKEVDFYANWEQNRQVRLKYKIPSITWEPHNWPPFLSEGKAKEIILAIANKIGLPKDAEFHDLKLDKEDGHWDAIWIRKYNGFQYEGDYIEIKIMAVDGEFYLYGKGYDGKPCPTEVKVTKEKAIEAGLKEIWRLQGTQEKQKPNYQISSAELRIVQPNTKAGKFTIEESSESRLAWVLIYEIDPESRTACGSSKFFPSRMTIKIDAGTMKFLGGDVTRC